MGGGASTPEGGTVPGICRHFNAPKSRCTNNDCTELHICFHFATGGCQFGDKCSRTHLLTTVHNKAVLKANGWDDNAQHQQILTLLNEKFKPKATTTEENTSGLKVPDVCYSYNTLGCSSDDCKNLHLCLTSVTGICALGDKCHLKHDLATGGHNVRVLRNAKLLDTDQQVIASKLREKYIALQQNRQSKQEPKNKGRRPEQGHTNQQPGGTKPSEPLLKPGTKQDRSEYMGAPIVCIAHNKGGCNKASCPYLHACFSFIMGRCNRSGNCLKGHDIFQGEHNKEILRKLDLLGAKDVLAKIRDGYKARAAARAAATESDGATGGATPPPTAAQSRATPPASLTCSVCCEAFVRATTLGCTHTFCEDCVRRAERQGQPCPLCRAPIATAVRSLVIDDTVADWFDGRDEETRCARRLLEAERRRAAAVPQPLRAPDDRRLC